MSYTVPAILNATGYNWVLPAGAVIVAGANTNNITVDFPLGVVSGNITVQGTNACTNGIVSTFAVVVNPLPIAANNVAGADTVCQGSTWVSYYIPSITNATGYMWTLPVGASIISGANTNSINVNFANNAVSGNITVMATNRCGNGIVSNSFAVTVNPLPSAAGIIIGTDTVCEGQMAVVYSIPAIANASSYNWTVPAGASYVTNAGGDTITVDFTNGVMSGNITVEGINSCGVGASAMLAVVVNYLPGAAGAISGTTTVCEGEMGINFTVPAIANASGYNWTLPAGATIAMGNNTNSIQVDFAMGAASGNISVYATNGCGVGSASNFAITVNPLPTVTLSLNVDTLCLDAIGVALAGGMPAGGTYAGLGAINGNFYASLAGVGTHQIIYTYSANGCESSDTSWIVVDACTGINEMANNNSLRVYPNPTTNAFFIEAGLSKNENVRIEIVDVIGQTVFVSDENAAVGTFKKQIHTENFSKGVYFVSFKTKQGSRVQKIVVE